MSSYYPSFSYLGINSRDKGLVVSHFDADQGESDTFLGMEPVYTESADGSRRLDYGAKYNNVAVFRITVIKEDGGDFSVKEVRDNLRWLTGAKSNSSLDLFENFVEEFVSDDSRCTFELTNYCDNIFNVYVNGSIFNGYIGTGSDVNKTKSSITLSNVPGVQPALKQGDTVKIAYGRIKYSFTCRVTNAWQYKMDARTVGLILEFTSISPWAYSAKQVVSASIDGSAALTIDNKTDDLYGATPVNVIFENTTGGSLVITNNATGDITKVFNLSENETITMSNNMMILSSVPNKTFGNDFNFVFQRLYANQNKLNIDGTGNITFEYVYVIKIGDCAMDINVISDPICNDNGEIILDTLDWSRITGTPTTYQAYGITNVYSKVEVDMLVAGIEIDEDELSRMLVEELN